MMYDDLSMIRLSEMVLSHVKPGCENSEEIAALREQLEKQKMQICIQMQEHLEILEDCCDDATEPPWCGFSDDGKTLAIMAAGRPFDVFKFEESPKEADAHYLLLTQPHVIKAMIQRIRTLERATNFDSERRWTRDKENEDERSNS